MREWSDPAKAIVNVALPEEGNALIIKFIFSGVILRLILLMKKQEGLKGLVLIS